MELEELKREIEEEINSYVYEVPDGALGRPMPDEWVKEQLTQFRKALVEPEWRNINIRDTVEQMRGEAEPVLRKCVLVADDREGYELYFDPEENNFVLAYSGNPPTTFNVRGDAVGCFMAR